MDQLLVERRLVSSREKAQAVILAGQVLVNGQKATKAGQFVDTASEIEVRELPRYVSRGGLKLEAALKHFGFDVREKVCLDIGASTGGFTDCLLQHGAARVYAFDTGIGQLDWKLRNDPRVISREKTNARYLTAQDVPEPVDVLVCDVSFISITMILPVLPQFLAPHGVMVLLIKPQFELERGQVGKGGIVRDPALHEIACRRVEAQVQALHFITEVIASPVLGTEGNQEFFLYARR